MGFLTAQNEEISMGYRTDFEKEYQMEMSMGVLRGWLRKELTLAMQWVRERGMNLKERRRGEQKERGTGRWKGGWRVR